MKQPDDTKTIDMFEENTVKTYQVELKRVSYVSMEIEAYTAEEAESKAWAEVEMRGDSGYADWELTLCEETGTPEVPNETR